MIGAGGVGPVGRIHGSLEKIQVITNPVLLGGRDVMRLGLMIFKGLPRMPRATRGRKGKIAGAILVLLNNVTARDGWFVRSGGGERIDVDSVLAYLNALEKNHHSIIIPGVGELA